MFRIRNVPDARTPANQSAIAEARDVILAQLPGLGRDDLDALPERLSDPYAHRFVTELFVAEDGRSRVKGAAVLLYDPELEFAFLDAIASLRGGGGVGGALYGRLRAESAELGARGLYFESLPEEGAHKSDNTKRLKFYERFGARPIEGTGYRTLLSRDGDASEMPYLVFDGLGRFALPPEARMREIVRAILERRYAELCPPAYIDEVAGSIAEGDYSLREPRYGATQVAAVPAKRPISIIVNEKHDIHHIRERGYVESPVRVKSLLDALIPTGQFERIPAKRFPNRWITAVHDASLVEYIARACAEAPDGKSVYPYVFPVRNAARKPKEQSVLAGYWCIDTFTPINRNAWPAARAAADCALTAADAILEGAQLAYALVRPPGHHAERKTFGGFCYICNGAVAAEYLSRYGRVAMLDTDYHHGNGQQDIFYERDDVLTVSIHGDPSFAYPYFTGFRNETGRGAGAGFNVNIPLPETIEPERYHQTLAKALQRIADYGPDYLVLSLGFDIGKGDPTGTWPLRPEDFRRIGAAIGGTGLPITVIQEGGYRVATLGANARAFFEGLSEGAAGAPRLRPRSERPAKPARRRWSRAVHPDDPRRIRELVMGTEMFSAEEVAIAEELATERIARGRASGYEFVLVSEGDKLLGYACFGRVPGSDASWDLYWIAVDRDDQGKGLGRDILAAAEKDMRRSGAARAFSETSTREGYAGTRAFYERSGYTLAAEFPNFYRAGDGKAVYAKDLA